MVIIDIQLLSAS